MEVSYPNCNRRDVLRLGACLFGYLPYAASVEAGEAIEEITRDLRNWLRDWIRTSINSELMQPPPTHFDLGAYCRGPGSVWSPQSEIIDNATNTSMSPPGIGSQPPECYSRDDHSGKFSSGQQDLLDLATKVLMNMPRQERDWTTLDFASKYLNPNDSGEPVNLADVGLDKHFENSASVRAAIQSFVSRAMAEASAPGASAFLLVTDRAVTTNLSESSFVSEIGNPLFSLGHSSLELQAACTADACHFSFSIKDEFSKPLWSDSRQLGIKADFGNTFEINHRFGLPVPYARSSLARP